MEIVPGNRVLLANKVERNRRKLVDRWGDMVYAVVSSNPQTHTFEVRNPVSGQSKIAHRNLLLCVNFLPVLPEIEDSASLASSCSLAVGDAVDLPDESSMHLDVVSLHSPCGPGESGAMDSPSAPPSPDQKSPSN